VRPERVQLAGADGACANPLDATVRELIYLGDQIRLRIELAGKHEFTIKAPVSQLDRSLRPGDAIRVGLDPAHTRALDVPAAH
jgi:putative spermidine/putrescine transport system ATP-binding protein